VLGCGWGSQTGSAGVQELVRSVQGTGLRELWLGLGVGVGVIVMHAAARLGVGVDAIKVHAAAHLLAIPPHGGCCRCYCCYCCYVVEVLRALSYRVGEPVDWAAAARTAGNGRQGQRGAIGEDKHAKGTGLRSEKGG